MRIVIQRTKQASVSIGGEVHASTGCGMMILAGCEHGDTQADADWLATKTVALRIFDDDSGVMNRSIVDVNGEILCISQFTLTASTRKGNRPSYIRAMPGSESQPLYEYFCQKLESLLGNGKVKRGVFGADMQVELINDGPVTIIIDSRLRE